MNEPRLLPAATRVATPWKNGGGITREVAIQPSAAAPGFDWRISVADIDGAGPFSRYPGVDRILAVLEGRLELTIADEQPVRLTPRSAAAYFPGEAGVSAVPLSKVSRDLNIMTRRGVWRSHLSTLQVDDETHIAGDAGIALAVSLGNLTLQSRHAQWTLGYLDALLFDGAMDLAASPVRESSALVLVRLFEQA